MGGLGTLFAMKKFLVLIVILVITPIIGGLYGILHDQLTYTIAPEYYTKFKFYQFGLIDIGNEAIFPNPRLQVSVVGFLATWWLGIPVGLVLGFVGLIQKDSRTMFFVTFKSAMIAVSTALVIGLIGLLYGIFYLSKTGVSWWLPDNLEDVESFIAVGSMHNFSYLGGLIGLVVAVTYSINQKRKLS